MIPTVLKPAYNRTKNSVKSENKKEINKYLPVIIYVSNWLVFWYPHTLLLATQNTHSDTGKHYHPHAHVNTHMQTLSQTYNAYCRSYL